MVIIRSTCILMQIDSTLSPGCSAIHPVNKNERMQKRDVILLYARAPAAGRVKSRLAVGTDSSAGIGADAAAEVYRHLLMHCLAQLQPLSGSARLIAETPDAGDTDALSTLAPWLDAVRPQSGADIGERMRHSFARAFSEGASAALLAGSDLPDIHTGIFQEGFESLRSHDVVIGPACDGGYYLIGMREPYPSLFEITGWGGPHVLRDTLRQAEALRIRVALLPELQDIDTAAALNTWLQHNLGHPLRAPLQTHIVSHIT